MMRKLVAPINSMVWQDFIPSLFGIIALLNIATRFAQVFLMQALKSFIRIVGIGYLEILSI